MMGVDAIYPQEVPDAELLGTASSEGRMLLSRDRALVDGAGDLGFYIEALDLDGQVLEFMGRFGAPGDWFTRCTACNGPLSGDEPAGCSGAVPEGIEHRHAEIWSCRSCGQRYWPGTQYASILKRLEGLRVGGCYGEVACDGPR